MNLAGRLLVGAGLLLLVMAGICYSIHLRNDRYLLRATAFIFDGPGDDESKAKALSHFVALNATEPADPDSASLIARVEHRLPLELSPVTVLKEGFAFPDAKRYGPCGQMSRTIRAVAWLRHIRSHKVLLGTGAGEHAMVALYVDGAFRLFDPTYDFYWTDSTGHVATIDEVRRDTAIFAQVFRKVPGYPYRLDDATYFRWSRLGRPGAWLKSALTAVMGRAWVEGLDTPKLYERPWWGYTVVNLFGAIFLIALGLSRFGRRNGAAGRQASAS